MKIKVIAILLVAMLFLSACGTEYAETIATEDVTSKIEATEPTENIIEPTKPTEVETQEETQPLQEEKKEIIMPKPKIVYNSQSVLESLAEENGIEFKIEEDNIIFTASDSSFDNMAAEYHDYIQELAEVKKPIKKLSHIRITDDYKTIELYVENDADEEALAAMTAIYMEHMAELQMLDGVIIKDIEYTQRFMNASTGEFVDEVVLPGGDMDIFGHINEIAKYMEN